MNKLRFTDFQVVSVLGEGSYGKVFQVIPKYTRADSDQSFSSCTTPTSRSHTYSSQQKCYAIKVIEKKLITLEDKSHEVHTEKLVLSQMRHPSIIKIYSSFHDSKNLYFLLEMMPNGSLHDFLKREQIISVKLAKQFTAEIVIALEYLRKC